MHQTPTHSAALTSGTGLHAVAARATANIVGGSVVAPSAPQRRASSRRSRVGELVAGRYRLLERLGGGGVGEIYAGRDVHIDGRTVALKILDPTRASRDPEERRRLKERFHREAAAAAQVSHPGVVTIHDLGETEAGEPFIVMERLHGHDLRAEVARGPMPPRRALRLISGALQALAEAHRRGVIHKDLKPANLVVRHPGEDDERLVLVDFGIAYIDREGYPRLTQAGQMALTPNYAPPEYIGRQEVSPAVDVYQLGLILVELIMGRPVVNLQSAGLCIAAHAQGALAIPRTLLDSPLGPIIRRALALNPADRYPDAAEMARDLAQVHPDAVAPIPAGDRMVLLSGVSPDGLDPSGADALPTLDLAAGARLNTLTPEAAGDVYEVELRLPRRAAPTAQLRAVRAAPPAQDPTLARVKALGAWLGVALLMAFPGTWLVLGVSWLARWFQARAAHRCPTPG